MVADIIQLPSAQPLRTPIGHAIRTGEWSYRQLENLHAEGRLPATTVIIDASKARFQKEFIASLKDSGAEIILDTKCAELSEIGCYLGAAKGAPWALKEEARPFTPDDFRQGANVDIFGGIARLAVEIDANAVLSPSRFLRNGTDDNWWNVDRAAPDLLRAALDREGGEKIGIEYALLIPHTTLHDPDQQQRLCSGLTGLPYDNLTLRLSGFGAGSGPAAMKRTFQAIQGLQGAGHPIVLDHIGGLIGTGALALGIVSGIGQGIGERERFDARAWHKPPKRRDPDAGGGRATYFPVPDFDRSFLKRDFDLIESTPGGRRLVSCDDPQCCLHGLISMRDNLKAHIAYKQLTSIQELSKVPNRHRASHFLDNEMRSAERKARDLSRLQTNDKSLNERLAKGRKRIDSLARTFESLVVDMEDNSPPPIIRGARNPGTKSTGTV